MTPTETIQAFLDEIKRHEATSKQSLQVEDDTECCGIMEPCTFMRTALPKCEEALMHVNDWIEKTIAIHDHYGRIELSTALRQLQEQIARILGEK